MPNHRRCPGLTMASHTVSGRCYRFGSSLHMADTFLYKEAKCGACGKVGHLQKVCKARSKKTVAVRLKKLSEAVARTVHSVRTNQPDVQPMTGKVVIEDAEVHMELDTGCVTTIMPLSRFQAVLPHFQHLPSDITLQVVND